MYDLQYIITGLGLYTFMIIIVWILAFVGEAAGRGLFDLVEWLYEPRRKRLADIEYAKAAAKAAEEDERLRVVE